MSFALLFAGQGTQHAAMLPWLESEPVCRAALDAMQRYTGAAWRERLLQASTRSSNALAQPLITGTSLAAWAALNRHLCEQGDAPDAAMPAVAAGYSVGEMAAFACARVLDADDAIALAAQRADLMDATVAGRDTGLLSVAGMDVEAVLAGAPLLDCAIHIAPDHAIYAGETVVLDACHTQLAALGATCKRLDVRVASHSRWMADAAVQFASVLQNRSFNPPACSLVLNVTGAATRQVPVLRQGLSRQLCGTVQWAAAMDAIAEQGVRCVMEIGAGNALSRMWNTQHAGIPARALEDFRDAAGAARWIRRNRGSSGF